MSKKIIKSRKNSHLCSTTEVLHSLLQNGKSPLAAQFKRWRLWQNWPDVVGEMIAKNSLPVSYSNNVLYIWVKNSVVMQELIFIRKPIIDKINDYMGTRWVKSVTFTVDKKSVPDSEEDKEFNHALKSFNK